MTGTSLHNTFQPSPTHASRSLPPKTLPARRPTHPSWPLPLTLLARSLNTYQPPSPTLPLLIPNTSSPPLTLISHPPQRFPSSPNTPPTTPTHVSPTCPSDPFRLWRRTWQQAPTYEWRHVKPRYTLRSNVIKEGFTLISSCLLISI